MGKVHAVCISTIRGIAKQAVPEGKFVVDWGIEGDAHAEHWHRQVSLLGLESIERSAAAAARWNSALSAKISSSTASISRPCL